MRYNVVIVLRTSLGSRYNIK